MKNLLMVTFAAVSAAACNGTPVQTPAPSAPVAVSPFALADAKANEALATLGGVLRGADPNARYELGEALPLHYVSAAALRDCNQGCTPETLIAESFDRIYPVLSSGRVVASITLHNLNGEWLPAVIGQGGASGALVEARNQLRRSQKADGDSYALVHVTGMNVRLLAHREQASLMLTALNKGETLHARAAADVLTELATRAR